MIRTLICLVLPAVSAHAETKRNWPRKNVGPATLVIFFVGRSSGRDISHTIEFDSIDDCEKSAKKWRKELQDWPVAATVRCDKWLQIAPKINRSIASNMFTTKLRG